MNIALVTTTMFLDSKVHGANMGPTWVLSAPDGPHIGSTNLAIGVLFIAQCTKLCARPICLIRDGTWQNSLLLRLTHQWSLFHETRYSDVIMGALASQITSLTIVYSIVYSGADQSSASLAFVRGIHQGSANSPHKWPVTRKMFPFDDVFM